MEDKLLQDIALMIHGYYQARGRGLESTCKKVYEHIKAQIDADNILEATNAFKLSRAAIDTLTWCRGDVLLTREFNRVTMYESDTIHAYNAPTLKNCKWIKVPNSFASVSVTIDELVVRGATVYLMRRI